MARQTSALASTADCWYFVEIRHIPGKGRGVFARQFIPIGTRILREKILIRSVSDAFIGHGYGRTYVEGMLATIRSLPAHERAILDRMEWSTENCAQYLFLPYAQELNMRTADAAALAIVLSNAYHGNVARRATNFNHSCMANCVQSDLDVDNGEIVVHAMRGVEPGEELTCSYIDNAFYIRNRIEGLRRFDFYCRCTACFGRGMGQWEKERDRMLKMDQQLWDYLIAAAPLRPNGQFDIDSYELQARLRVPQARAHIALLHRHEHWRERMINAFVDLINIQRRANNARDALGDGLDLWNALALLRGADHPETIRYREEVGKLAKYHLLRDENLGSVVFTALDETIGARLPPGRGDNWRHQRWLICADEAVELVIPLARHFT